jgi:hypothetical protein
VDNPRFCRGCGIALSQNASPTDDFKAATQNRNTIDLLKERAEMLEDTQRRFGGVWLKYGYKSLGLAIASAAFFAVILIIGYFVGIFKPHNLVEYVGAIIIFGAGVFFFFFTISKALYAVRILIGTAPRAPCTPTETIRLFFVAPLQQMVIQTSQLGTVPWLQSYICLLDQVKEKEGDYDAFVSRWRDRAKNILDLVRERLQPKLILQISYNTSIPDWLTVQQIGRDNGVITYHVSIRIDAKEGIDNPGISSAKDIGPVHLIATAKVAQVGERWYLADEPMVERVE